MLNVVEESGAGARSGPSRRSFLRVGALGLGGLSLADLMAARAAAKAGRDAPEKAVVLLFLQGGPPQHETFDPKMGAPAEVRSTTGEVKTKLPGVTFGGTFPKMAALADRLAVVRSFASKNGNHSYETTVHGGFQAKAAVGALYARMAGPLNPATGVPSNAVVVPEAVREGLKLGGAGGTGSLNSLITPGSLGGAYQAFNPAGGDSAATKRLMELAVPRDRFADRRALLDGLDAVRRASEADGDRFGRLHRQAFDVILRGTAAAFDLSKEGPKVVERYDTTHVYKMEDWWKYGNFKRSTNLLGRQMLLARRLVEHGCGFVTVSDCGWDFHADNVSPPGMTGMRPLGSQVDHAVAAFLEDVRERGLEDRVLLIITGEMGRTPKLNKEGGRDHWGDVTPLVFAGGGLRMGQVIGESDRLGAAPRTEVYTPANLVATVMHYLFDAAAFRTRTDVTPGVKDVFDNGKPIRELFEG
jgi:uncharacterized protein (DUF1501 family)